MRALKYKDENEIENGVVVEPSIKEYTSSLIDLFMIATISSSILVGFSIISAFYFRLEDIIIFIMLFSSWIICCIVTIIKYYNFKIIRDGYNIKICYGLFYKKEVNIPINTIQSLIIVEGVIKKPLGYFSLKVQTIGYGKDKGQSTMLCPIAKRKVLNKFLEDIIPEMNVTYDLRNSPAKALNEFLLYKLLEEVLVIGLIAVFIPNGYYIFLMIPFLIVWNNVRFKDNGLYYGNDFVVMRFRKLNRKTVIINKVFIQSFEKEQNIFQKRKAIAKYQVTIAGDRLGRTYKVGYISQNNFS